MRREALQEQYSLKSLKSRHENLSRSVPRYPGGRAVSELFYRLRGDEVAAHDVGSDERPIESYMDIYAQFVIDYAIDRSQPVDDGTLQSDLRLLGAALRLLELESYCRDAPATVKTGGEVRAHIATLAAEYAVSPWEPVLEDYDRSGESRNQARLRMADVALFAASFTGAPHDSYQIAINGEVERTVCAHSSGLACARCSLRYLYFEPVRNIDAGSSVPSKERADNMLQAAVLSRLESPADAAVLAENLYRNVS